MKYEKIAVETHGPVGIIKLNEPAKLNAVSGQMIVEMDQAFDTLATTVRAIILTGAGRAFCSGAALDGRLGAPGVDRSQRDAGEFLESHINPLMSKLRDLPIPWITAVRGPAAGVGASFALAGDLVVASENAYFLQAFARIGLVPDGGSTHLLVRTIGRVRTMELALLADRLPAAKALEWGLINRVVADATLEDEAMKIASTLAAGPCIALGMIRRSVWNAVDADWARTLDAERNFQRTARRTEDFDEGLAAFAAKRPAVFTGK